MRKKQFLALIVAVLLFAATGYLSVTANTRAQERSMEMLTEAEGYFSDELNRLWGSTDEVTPPESPYVALVRVDGTIAAASETASLYTTGFDLNSTLDYIDAIICDEHNVGMLLYIDSPGGEMGASDELYLKLMDYKEITGRPIYCYFGDYACSGGYYVAMCADEIYANRNSICVNIGVYISSYNFSELFEKYGIEQVTFKSSENKGIGMPGTPWTEEQKEIYQSIVDLYYQQFLDVVAEGRGMSTDEVRARDDGREMLAIQALEAGFIDGICRYEEYEESVLSHFAEGTEIFHSQHTPGLLDEFFFYMDSRMPHSDAQVWTDFAEAHSGLVVMAYADEY